MQIKDSESSQMCTMTVQRPQIQVKIWEILVKYTENYLLLGDSNTGAFWSERLWHLHPCGSSRHDRIRPWATFIKLHLHYTFIKSHQSKGWTTWHQVVPLRLKYSMSLLFHTASKVFGVMWKHFKHRYPNGMDIDSCVRNSVPLSLYSLRGCPQGENLNLWHFH